MKFRELPPERKRILAGWLVKRVVMALYDIIAINLAYFIALVIRFYINGHFREIANRYLPPFYRFAPYNTVICLVLFVIAGLYSSRWKRAGINDLTRIFVVNVLTVFIHVILTVLFVKRMPISYYLIGGILQFFLVAILRFGFRIFRIILTKIKRMKTANVNVMIAGMGETARIVREQIERDEDNLAKPVCIFNYHPEEHGGTLDSLHVVSGMDRFEYYLEKYQVACVILADALMPADIRKTIKEKCKAGGIEVQDFSGFLNNESGEISLRQMMELVQGTIEIRLDGVNRIFETGEQVMTAYPGRYTLQSVSSEKDHMVIEMTNRNVIINNLQENWVRDTEAETGNEISFF